MLKQLSFIFLLISWLVPGATASAFDDLTNEDAAALLEKHEMFAATQTIRLLVGTIHARLSDVERYQPNYAAFKAMGLIDLASITIESVDKDPGKKSEGTRVSLTEKGSKESAGWTKEQENSWIITIATRKLVDIIKIHKDNEDRIHGIEFSWTWAPNEIGEGIKFIHKAERAYAKLERDGENWRIVSIHAL